MKKPPKRPETMTEIRIARLRRRMTFDPEATQITEFRPDGVPVGIGTGNTVMMPNPLKDAASPWFLVGAMWAIVAVMTVYGVGDLRAFVQHDEAFAEHETIVAAIDGLESFSHAVGPARVRAALDSLFSPIKSKTADEEWLAAAADLPAEDPPVDSGGAESSGKVGAKRRGPTRILLMGASSMEFYLGAELERRLENYRDIKVHRFGKLGTGLARPDQFNWPRQITKLLASFKPHLVIGQFGGNDGQPMRNAAGKTLLFGTPEWESEYTQRVTQVVRQVRSSGSKMVMLGMPITRHKKHSDKLALINDLTQKATETAGGRYVPTWDLAANEKGGSRDTISFDGKSGPMYLVDGVHFARVGAAFVAQKLAWRLERLLALVPANPQLAAVFPLEMTSAARKATVNYLAFVPQGLREEERLPTLLLLHGAAGSSVDFSENAHELLQRMSVQHRLILVAPDADPHGWYLDSPILVGSQIETFLMTELIPELERRLPTSGRLGIAGISMGGNGALRLAMKYPHLFVSASSMSGAVDLTQAVDRPALMERLGLYAENPRAWEAHSTLHLVRSPDFKAPNLPLLLTVGTQDRWVEANRQLDRALTEAGVPHDFKELAGGHSWGHWVKVLPDHLSWHTNKLQTDLKPLPAALKQ